MFKFLVSVLMVMFVMVGFSGVVNAQTVTAVVKVCDNPNVQFQPYQGKGYWTTSQGTTLSSGAVLNMSGDMTAPNNHYVFNMYNVEGTQVTGVFDWFTNEMNGSSDYNFNMIVLNACSVGVPGNVLNPPYDYNH